MECTYYSAKIISFSLDPIVNRMGCTAIRNERCFFERIVRTSNLTALMRLLHDLDSEELVFKTVWEFFDIPIGYFAIHLSSLLIKILATHYVEGHWRRSIWKTEFPRTKFQGNPLSLRTSLIRSKRAHSRKNEVGFLFCFQNFPNNSRYWMTTCQVMITL